MAATDSSRGDAEDGPIGALLEGRERFLGYVRSKVSDPELAEDILQESLLKALRSAPELKDEERLVPWFYRVLQNAITDAYRRRAVERQRVGGLEVERLGELEPAAEPSAEEEAVLCECFRPLVPALRGEYAELIEALDLGSETSDQAATRLGITANNLKVRHHRARQALRKRLEETCRVCAEHHCLDCTCDRARARGAAAT